MKITCFVIGIPLLLALTPPKRPKLPKDILGLWAMRLNLSLENRYEPTHYGKTTDPEVAIYEFKKNGEVIVQGMVVYCNTGTPAIIHKKTISKGTWTIMSDSTLDVTIKQEEEEFREICWLYRNKQNELEMKMYHRSK